MDAAVAENSENKTANDIPAENQESSLEAGIAESKEAIATAAPVKKRGRQKLPRDKDGNIIREEKTASNPKPATESAGASIPSLPPTYLKPALNFPFKAMALKTGFAQWELTDKEQEENAIFLDLCLKRYLPQMQSEHPELLALGIGLGMASLSRYLGYRAFLESREKENAVQSNQGRETVTVEIPPQSGVSTKKGKQNRVNPEVNPSASLTGFLDGTESRSPQI